MVAAQVAAGKLAPAAAQEQVQDVHSDPRWAGIKWAIYRGIAYDITSFIPRHPGGEWLVNLAVGRDCTALFESYHLRHDIALQAFGKLPQLADFPVHAVARAPYPGDSKLYSDIKQRVRKEVFEGREARGWHRQGAELAAAAVLSFAVASYVLYARYTGWLAGLVLGIAGGWIGVTIQHCGNHGAMSTVPLINNLLGLCNDLIGGASLMWRYHHQVSHHIHTNDQELDEDVCSCYPLLRFDTRLPRRAWHAWQHLYIWVAYPFMHLAFQLGDFNSLLQGRTVGAELLGASTLEKASVLLGKAAHYALLLAVPALLHGIPAALAGAAGYSISLSIVLAVVFFVSHNMPENKPNLTGADETKKVLYTPLTERDWGVQQVLASANWGGVVGNFFTGGLNLQVEHHLFPAISFVHYPAIARIVAEECAAAGVHYVHHPTLGSVLRRFVTCLKELGSAPDDTAAAAALKAKAV